MEAMMAHDSPPYPEMKDWLLREKDGKVYGPPHPVDGGDYAALDTASGYSPDFSIEVVKRWNKYAESEAQIAVLPETSLSSRELVEQIEHLRSLYNEPFAHIIAFIDAWVRARIAEAVRGETEAWYNKSNSLLCLSDETTNEFASWSIKRLASAGAEVKRLQSQEVNTKGESA